MHPSSPWGAALGHEMQCGDPCVLPQCWRAVAEDEGTATCHCRKAPVPPSPQEARAAPAVPPCRIWGSCVSPQFGVAVVPRQPVGCRPHNQLTHPACALITTRCMQLVQEGRRMLSGGGWSRSKLSPSPLPTFPQAALTVRLTASNLFHLSILGFSIVPITVGLTTAR